MRDYTNIDKSGFRKGEYVGYCNGAKRIRLFDQGWHLEGVGYFATLREANAYCAANNGK